jgi:predicted DCC family thiol-disulfide oxidoreductase YuxK
VTRARSLTARIAAVPAYSYRGATVPPFDDAQPLIVYDGVCVLCSRSMRWIAEHDRAEQIRFTAAQSSLGAGLLRHYGIDPLDFDSFLLVADGRGYAKLDALLEVLQLVGAPWRWLAATLSLLPQSARDRLYDIVAKNRYRWFGRAETCLVPDAAWRARVID